MQMQNRNRFPVEQTAKFPRHAPSVSAVTSDAKLKRAVMDIKKNQYDRAPTSDDAT